METFFCMLETSGFPDRHTSRINIANRLSEIDEKYCINQKVNTVVHDSAANMLGALNILNDKHNWDSLRLTVFCPYSAA